MSVKELIQKIVSSFDHASQGVPIAFKGRNMRIHGIAALLVICFGLWFTISKTEWIVILMLIGLIWSAEMMNTAIENLANVVRDSLGLSYSATKEPRDIAAGAVLIMSVIAAIVGLIIFYPYLLGK